jgi:hypothetical protein
VGGFALRAYEIGDDMRSHFLVMGIAWLLIRAVEPLATGGMLQPSDDGSLGPVLSASGVYQVNTSTNVMTLPGGGTITGNGSGVFTFGSIDISNAVFVVQGDSPFALLSQGNLTLNSASIDVSAQGQTPGAGGNVNIGQGGDGYIGGAGGGGFGTAGGQGGPFVFTGDPHGPPPWGYYYPGAPGGASYGGINGPIEGGSAGGNFFYTGNQMGSGGAGGGAVELGANGTLSLSDVAISANGGDASGYAAGGGSGGGITLLGSVVDVDASSPFSALGGTGGGPLSYGGPSGATIGGGGNGGEGRIDVEGQQIHFLGSTNGVVEFPYVPEPSSLLSLALGIAGVLLARVASTLIPILSAISRRA